MKRKLKLSTLNVESFVTSTNKAENTDAILGGFPIPTDTNQYVCINYTRILGKCDASFTKYPVCEPTLYNEFGQCNTSIFNTLGTECFNTNNVCVTNLGNIC